MSDANDSSNADTDSPDEEPPEHVIDFEDERKIVLEQRFPSRRLVKLQNDAPDLVDDFMGIFEADEQLKEADEEFYESVAEEVAENDGEVDEEQLREANEAREQVHQLHAREKFQRKGALLHTEVSLDELDALHEFCASMIDRVEGYEDEEGDALVWKHLEDDRKRDFVDMELSSAIKLTIYMYAYTQKAGL